MFVSVTKIFAGDLTKINFGTRHSHSSLVGSSFMPMTIKDGLKKQLEHYVRGAQVFHKEDLISAIKGHNLIFANDVRLIADESFLKIEFDDEEITLELIWREDGPRSTLIEIRSV